MSHGKDISSSSEQASSGKFDRYGWYQPTPADERKSRDIGIVDYAILSGKYAAIGAIGAAIGWAFAKSTGIKVKIPEYMRRLGKDAGEIYGRELWQTEYFQPGSYAGLGAHIAVIGKLFLEWRREEAARIGVEDMYKDIRDVAVLHQSNEDIAKDNELLRRMIEFEREKQQQASHCRENMVGDGSSYSSIATTMGEQKGTASTDINDAQYMGQVADDKRINVSL